MNWYGLVERMSCFYVVSCESVCHYCKVDRIFLAEHEWAELARPAFHIGGIRQLLVAPLGAMVVKHLFSCETVDNDVGNDGLLMVTQFEWIYLKMGYVLEL